VLHSGAWHRFASGLVTSFKALLGVRSLVGIGEASYAPAAVSMLTDNFPDETNSQVQGIFNIGMLIGGTVGAILGGVVAYYSDNWRLAFFIASIPGFFLAYVALTMKDKKLVHNEPKISITTLLKNHAYLWIIISGTFVSFARRSVYYLGC
jgi:MFS family permease